MIENISYLSSNTSTIPTEKLINEINNYSFGFHPSFDDKIHNITLLFPVNPGEHVINRFWHKSQKYKRLNDGSIEFYLTCRIDIELLGWIMMWMDNVKIIEPPILKEYYINKVQTIKTIYLDNRMPLNNG
jgi:hypothetical protein